MAHTHWITSGAMQTLERTEPNPMSTYLPKYTASTWGRVCAPYHPRHSTYGIPLGYVDWVKDKHPSRHSSWRVKESQEPCAPTRITHGTPVVSPNPKERLMIISTPKEMLTSSQPKGVSPVWLMDFNHQRPPPRSQFQGQGASALWISFPWYRTFLSLNLLPHESSPLRMLQLILPLG